jgi:Concanavalin A-like lectin/glucanases superfamily
MSATVEAGREAVVWLRVRNTGDIVEEYHVDVVGDPALWCSVEPSSLRLYPGTTGSARLAFAPPRSPDAVAGPHPYGVRVRPAEVPDAVMVPEGNLSVIPFVDIHAELLPVTVRGWHRARPRLVVDNNGNTTVTASVVAAASGNRVDFDIREPSFQIPPGRAHFSVLKVRPERLLWLGRKVSHPFTAMVQPSGSEPAAVTGTYVQTALLPTWMSRLGMVLAALLAAFIALWLLARPTVSSDATAQVLPAPTVSTAPLAGTATPVPSATPATTRPPAAATSAPAVAASPKQAQKPATVSLPEPVSWWKLYDSTGTTAADVMGINPATGSNIGWCQTKNCAGFDGTNSDFVTAGPVLNTGPGTSFTVATWLWMYNAPATGFATLVSQDGSTNSGFYLQYAGVNNGSWAFSRVGSDTSNPTPYRALSDKPAAMRTWIFLTGVFNGATNQLQLYVDGVLQDTVVTDPTPYAAEGALAMGRGQYNGGAADWYPGLLSNVEVWNTALSGAQIKVLSERPG